MSGKELKKILFDNGYKLNDLAYKLGILPQSLNSKLNASDIKTGFLEEIMGVINKSIYFFYPDQSGIDVDEAKESKLGNGIDHLLNELNHKDEKIEKLENTIRDKEEIIKGKDEIINMLKGKGPSSKIASGA